MKRYNKIILSVTIAWLLLVLFPYQPVEVSWYEQPKVNSNAVMQLNQYSEFLTKYKSCETLKNYMYYTNELLSEQLDIPQGLSMNTDCKDWRSMMLYVYDTYWQWAEVITDDLQNIIL